MTFCRRLTAFAALVLALASSTSTAASESAAARVAAARLEGKVVVYSVLSTKAAQPLIRDFSALYPGIAVEYDGDKGSNEMDARYRSETAKSVPTADVVWSSAMDMQMKLVSEGYAVRDRSPEAATLPRWANYRDTAFEPVVIVYNRTLVTGSDIPANHAAIAALIDGQLDRFRGKVTGFDLRKSGVSFMFAAQDFSAYPRLDQLLATFGKADFQASGGTGEMLTAINAGTYLLGYNMMGAYALSRAKKDLPNLGVAFPNDYTLVLSRIAFVSKRATHPAAARLWLDYLLSARGQTIMGNALDLFPIREGVDAALTAASLRAKVGRAIRPIAVDMHLADSHDPTRHFALIARWKTTLTGVRGTHDLR